jgi:hypothetical protein
MISVIGMFLVIIIVSVSVASVFSQNLHQANLQANQIRAHYLAVAGIDLAVSALLFDPADPDQEPLIESLKWDKDAYPDIADDLVTRPEFFDIVEIEDDEVAVTITPINSGSKREIVVHALGTLHGSGVTKSLTLIFDAENPLVLRWE